MRCSRLLVLPALLALIGCGGQFPPEDVAPDASGPVSLRVADTERITREELLAADVATAYEAVDRLHRAWFRDQLTGKPVSVFTDDDQSLGGAESLRKLPASELAELRHLDGRAATLRWPAAEGGAIIVFRAR